MFTNSSSLDTDTMQALAREMNLSETVFVLPRSGDAHARVRIFTPREELPFAGHPVLGTAFVLGRAMEGREVRLELAIDPVAVTARTRRTAPALRLDDTAEANARPRGTGSEHSDQKAPQPEAA